MNRVLALAAAAIVATTLLAHAQSRNATVPLAAGHTGVFSFRHIESGTYRGELVGSLRATSVTMPLFTVAVVSGAPPASDR
jgi:hypothetical protein